MQFRRRVTILCSHASPLQKRESPSDFQRKRRLRGRSVRYFSPRGALSWTTRVGYVAPLLQGWNIYRLVVRRSCRTGTETPAQYPPRFTRVANADFELRSDVDGDHRDWHWYWSDRSLVRCAGQVVSATYQSSILTKRSKLVYRLGDIREGRCDRGIFYNQTVCCSGLDCEPRTFDYVTIGSRWAVAGEVCTSWQTWSEYLNITSILGQSLLQSLIYVALAVRFSPTSSAQSQPSPQVVFSGSAAILVKTYAP